MCPSVGSWPDTLAYTRALRPSPGLAGDGRGITPLPCVGQAQAPGSDRWPRCRCRQAYPLRCLARALLVVSEDVSELDI